MSGMYTAIWYEEKQNKRKQNKPYLGRRQFSLLQSLYLSNPFATDRIQQKSNF